MLKINDLSIQYNKDITVENFNLIMNKGEVVSIVGESGSGKTTVIKSILGALSGNGKIVSGEIQFNNKSLIGLDNTSFRGIRGKQISMIFQDCGSSLNPIRKIGSQFEEYIRIHSKLSIKEAHKKAVNMLGRMNLTNVENIMDSYPHQLSGGMKQRVGIAMAMTFNPELLLADEPTSALDVTTQAQIVRQMMELRDEYNTGIIIVTHNLGVAAYMSDKIIVMEKGKVVDSGATDDILNNPTSEYTKKLLEAVPKMEVNRFA